MPLSLIPSNCPPLSDNCLDPNIYPRAKLVSEFGFQSFASLQSIRPFIEAEDEGPFSELTRSRQRHPNGDKELVAQMTKHFRLPASWAPRAAGGASNVSGADDGSPAEQYAHWIYLTQVRCAHRI